MGSVPGSISKQVHPGEMPRSHYSSLARGHHDKDSADWPTSLWTSVHFLLYCQARALHRVRRRATEGKGEGKREKRKSAERHWRTGAEEELFLLSLPAVGRGHPSGRFELSGHCNSA